VMSGCPTWGVELVISNFLSLEDEKGLCFLSADLNLFVFVIFRQRNDYANCSITNQFETQV
jgi:hypothetical protein